MRVVFTADAARDLDRIWDYLYPRSKTGAQRVLASIHAAAARAALFPDAGRPGKEPGIGEIVLRKYPYVLPYRVEGDVLIIVRVFHTAQDR